MNKNNDKKELFLNFYFNYFFKNDEENFNLYSVKTKAQNGINGKSFKKLYKNS